MAMINCPECGKPISEAAVTCPQCGFPLGNQKAGEREDSDFLAKMEKQAHKDESGAKSLLRGILILLAVLLIPLIIGIISAEVKGTTNQATASPNKTITEITQDIREVMSDSWGGNSEVRRSGKTVIADIWLEGVAKDAGLAIKGNREMLAAWDETVDALKKLDGNMQDYLNAAGYSSYIAVINLKNDENRDNTLLVISGGDVLLDVVHGIDLIN